MREESGGWYTGTDELVQQPPVTVVSRKGLGDLARLLVRVLNIRGATPIATQSMALETCFLETCVEGRLIGACLHVGRSRQIMDARNTHTTAANHGRTRFLQHRLLLETRETCSPPTTSVAAGVWGMRPRLSGE